MARTKVETSTPLKVERPAPAKVTAPKPEGFVIPLVDPTPIAPPVVFKVDKNAPLVARYKVIAPLVIATPTGIVRFVPGAEISQHGHDIEFLVQAGLKLQRIV